MMPLQRACGAESQVRNKLSNGPLRAQSNGAIQSILRRCRQAYKCRGGWYPAKCTGHAVNQGGTADKCIYSSLTESVFLSRAFFILKDVFD